MADLTDERIKILCIDDEAGVLRALERSLADGGYEIVCASTGESALEILAAGGPTVQIVITDYRMPEMTGVELLREVRRRWPETVRIVLSGHADATAIMAAVNEGEIYRFIAKPWHAEELKVAVANAAEHYRLNRENRLLSGELQTKNEELRRVNYTLERLVAEKVSKVAVQNKFLSLAHEVLDLLPVAVVALDAKGVVILCNRQGERLLGIPAGTFLPGGEHERQLPATVNTFIAEVAEKRAYSGRLLINDVCYSGKGICVQRKDGEGMILVLDEPD